MKPGWKTFVHRRVYRVEEFIDHVWGPDLKRVRALPPSTLFRSSRDPESGHGYFNEIVEPENPLAVRRPRRKPSRSSVSVA